MAPLTLVKQLQALINNEECAEDLDIVIQIGDEFYPLKKIRLSGDEEGDVLDKYTVIMEVE